MSVRRARRSERRRRFGRSQRASGGAFVSCLMSAPYANWRPITQKLLCWDAFSRCWRRPFFHWGDNGPFTAFTIGSVRQRTAVVIFTNGASGLSIMPDLIAPFIPGDRPSLVWLDYVGHQAPVRRVLRAALAQGIREVWSEADGAKLGLPELRWIAQGLSANNREADSLWVRAKIDERSSTIA